MMRKEIGSDYWITDQEYQSALLSAPKVDLPYVFRNVVFTNLCRTGIELFLEELSISKGIALVPEFTCHSVVDAFVNHGYEVHGYKLNTNLSINIDSFKDVVTESNPDVVIMHSYFGFNTIPERIREIIPKVILIEDLTQRFFSSFPLTEADCYVGSIRKWMPIPDGGFYGGYREIKKPDKEDVVFSKIELEALLCKGKYMSGEKIEKKTFRDAFTNAKRSINKLNHHYTMSKLSQQIYNSIDINQWKTTRQENCRFLVEHLKEFSFLKIPLDNIDDQTVPFLLPVFVRERRQEFQAFLAKNDIYATIIWTCPEILEKELSTNGKFIYSHILCFHCDQRYGLDDMKRVYNVIKDYNHYVYE